MKVSDGLRFRNILTGMGRMYGASPDDLLLDAYWIALSDWDIEAFQAAAKHLMQTAKFMPRPAEFNELKKQHKTTAGEAFSKAVDWVRKGTYKAPAKTPEAILIDRVIGALGGWQVICQCEEDKLHFLEKRFCEHFEAMQDSEATREALPQLAPATLQLVKRLTA